MLYETISRRDALNLGRRRFYTGRPCKNGHDAQRFVSTGGCVACNSDRAKAFSKASSVAANARARGMFAYELHPDDFAAARAYCQALDLARGRIPAQTPDAAAALDAEAIRKIRLAKFGHDQPPTQGSALDPAMAEQLAAFGVKP